jgi:hypothetical protein
MILVVSVRADPVEAVQEARLLIHRRQCGLDRRAGPDCVDQIGPHDIAVVVLSPNGLPLEPDRLLPKEVGAAELAVAIEPIAGFEYEVM